VALKLNLGVSNPPGIDSPSLAKLEAPCQREHLKTQATHTQIVEQSLLRTTDFQLPPPLRRPSVVFQKHVARQLFHRVRKQPLHGVEDDVGLHQVVGQAQLADGAVDREAPLVDPEQPFGFGVEELEVELPGPDEADGYSVRLGAGPRAGAEEAAY
jgi:hypothetical protein